jgi:hypothetical protein
LLTALIIFAYKNIDAVYVVSFATMPHVCVWLHAGFPHLRFHLKAASKLSQNVSNL